MGRRTKLLNNNTKDIILKYISNGNYIKTACLAAGIDEATYYSWIHKAENANGGVADKIYVEFLNDLKRAEAENIAKTMARIEDASEKPQYWMAGAWKLERKYPSEFGKRIELEVGPSKVLIALQERAKLSYERDLLEEGK